MVEWSPILNQFLIQAKNGDLKTSNYPKEWNILRVKISFGMGAPARIPWIAFVAPDMQVSNGIYPVYLFYKELETLILAYGISETEEFGKQWPAEIINSRETITAYFDKEVPRYGGSFVFKAYKINIKGNEVSILNSESNQPVTKQDLESDLETILSYYRNLSSIPQQSTPKDLGNGLFYMEKELENFIINNWEKTELGKKYDLIIEQGDILSQQYKTDTGPIDILAKDKVKKNFVVIELKKGQTSDDTIGQITRYMGWIKEKKGDNNVKGIIIAGDYDKKLFYALKMTPNIEVFLYEINFKLKEFNGTI